MKTPPVVLASTSRYRRELLARLGLSFETEAPGVDEAAFAAFGLAPRALAERLALEKCQAVARRRPGAIVIGSDQLVAVDGEILGKPGTAESAVAQLRKLSGRTHELVTALAVARGSDIHRQTDVTRLTMARLSEESLRRYVALDSPLDCAGSYKIESLGIALFERIESEDATAIQGLPLLTVARWLRGWGCLPIEG